MDPLILRALERILAVLVGGLSVYLGYRLFIKLPERMDSEGKVVLPGNISVYMSRVGPGAFFALFGAIVVALSFYYSITYTETTAAGKAPEQPGVQVSQERSKVYSGLGKTDTRGERQALESARALLRRDMFILNTLPSALRADIGPDRRVDIELAISRIKLALMKTVWDRDWGDPVKFEEWALKGATGFPPEALKEAVSYYRHGLEAMAR